MQIEADNDLRSSAAILVVVCFAFFSASVEKAILRTIFWFKKRYKAWSFLLRGPNIIQFEYDKANGSPFTVDVVDKKCLFITSTDHVKEIGNAPEDVLSLQAVAKVILQPTYTMHNFDWYDQRGVDGAPLVRSLRTMLTNNIPKILPDIHMVTSGMLEDAYEHARVVGDWKYLSLFPVVLKVVARTNAMAFLGPELAHNDTFVKAATNFVDETLLIAECVRLLPRPFSSIVGSALSKWWGSHHSMYDAMMEVANDRLGERERLKRGHTVPLHNDCIQWIMENSPRKQPWAAQRIVHELIALWFGSLHAMSISIYFALHELYLHPEYLSTLRMESESSEWQEFMDTGKGLPLLDSFIKESTRLNPIDALSSRRQALKPFTLSGGHQLEIGDWVAVPLKAMMRDCARYQKATEFHGFRFVTRETLSRYDTPNSDRPLSTETSDFTSTLDSHTWGSGRLPCPGRFYAAASIKAIVGHFLTKYDGRLVDPTSARCVTWRGFSLPKASTEVALRVR